MVAVMVSKSSLFSFLSKVILPEKKKVNAILLSKALLQSLLDHGLLRYTLVKLLFLSIYVNLYFIKDDGIRLCISFIIRYIFWYPYLFHIS